MPPTFPTRKRAFFGADEGAAVVEFAILFPLFLFMILFMLDAGRFLMVQAAMNNAALIGARAIAVSSDSVMVGSQALGSVSDSIARLAMLDDTMTNSSVGIGEYICPLNSESFSSYDITTGVTTLSPDGNCVDASVARTPPTTCLNAVANTRAMATASVSFKWITPVGLMVNLVSAGDTGSGTSAFFARAEGESTLIQGKAKLLCQN